MFAVLITGSGNDHDMHILNLRFDDLSLWIIEGKVTSKSNILQVDKNSIQYFGDNLDNHISIAVHTRLGRMSLSIYKLTNDGYDSMSLCLNFKTVSEKSLAGIRLLQKSLQTCLQTCYFEKHSSFSIRVLWN